MATLHGLEPRKGKTAYAFLVVRMVAPIARGALLALVKRMAPIVPDIDEVLAGLPEELDEPVKLVGLPWKPEANAKGVGRQRALVEDTPGVEAAWFFQTGTSLVPEDEVAAPGAEEDERDAGDTDIEMPVVALEDTWAVESDDEATSVTSTDDIDDDDDEDEDDDDEDVELAWSHGPPQTVSEVSFPVDGYPAIIEGLDWEDFGITVKLAGPFVPGESSVLDGLHTLWLAPYGGRHRNASVTIDRKHHAVHLWVDRFAAPTPNEEQVHHLLWIVSKLAEIVPVVHARFAGATMAQKYGGLMGDDSEPFVLGGNPLIPAFEQGGDAAVDALVKAPGPWSKEELGAQLRELAIHIVTGGDEEEDDDDDQEEDEDDGDDANAVDAIFESEPEAEAESSSDAEPESESESDPGSESDAESESEPDADRGDRSRYITPHAGELLAARARLGKLDRRFLDAALPLLASKPVAHDPRPVAAAHILGIARYQPAVSSLIAALDHGDDLASEAAIALGVIGDPTAIPALAKTATAPGESRDRARAATLDALASCLATAPEPRDLDDDVLAAALDAIQRDPATSAERIAALARIARHLPAAKRASIGLALATMEDRGHSRVARLAALANLGADGVDLAELRRLLHERLVARGRDHDATVHDLHAALAAAELVRDLVDPDDLRWIVRFTEPELRERARALLVALGASTGKPRIISDAGKLSDADLVAAIEDRDTIRRDAAIAEAARRGLEAARQPSVDAASEIVVHAELLHHEASILSAALDVVRAHSLDDDALALLDRVLRHPSPDVRDPLLRNVPDDPRLLPGMFAVLDARFGGQEEAARAWLEQFAGTPMYEAARRSVGGATPPDLILTPEDEDDDDDDEEEELFDLEDDAFDEDDDDEDDGEMN